MSSFDAPRTSAYDKEHINNSKATPLNKIFENKATKNTFHSVVIMPHKVFSKAIYWTFKYPSAKD